MYYFSVINMTFRQKPLQDLLYVEEKISKWEEGIEGAKEVRESLERKAQGIRGTLDNEVKRYLVGDPRRGKPPLLPRVIEAYRRTRNPEIGAELMYVLTQLIPYYERIMEESLKRNLEDKKNILKSIAQLKEYKKEIRKTLNNAYD